MAEKRPLCIYDGQIKELAASDFIVGQSQNHLWLGAIVSQYEHNLKQWDIVRVNENGLYTLAKANNPANAEVIGIVSNIIDNNTFQLTYSGKLEGFTGYPVGDVLFLSDIVDGGLTLTPPNYTGTVNKALLVVTSDTTGLFINWRGIEVREISDQFGSGFTQIFDVEDPNQKSYTLSFTPTPNLEITSLNGLILCSGINRDYTLNGNIITFNNDCPLEMGDVIKVHIQGSR